MSRRSLTLLIASVGTAVAIAVSVLVPVPYVILANGADPCYLVRFGLARIT